MSRTARIDATGQCILGRIGEAKRLFERTGLQDGEDRSEDFFLCDPSRGSDIGKDRRPDIPARLCDTALYHHTPFLISDLDVVENARLSPLVDHRPHLSPRMFRIADPQTGDSLLKPLEKKVIHGSMHDGP